MILMNKINKNFGNLHVLKDINLEVKEGEKVVVIGPSGSGKSTLIRCMNYLEEPTSGSVVIDGYNLRDKRTLNKVRQSTAMVFQQFNLYPHMTVLDNLTLAPIKLQNVSKKKAEESGLKYLEKVGLKEKADAYPTQLSGGQQQQLAIGRALASRPRLLILDEPTEGIQPSVIKEIGQVIRSLANRGDMAILLVEQFYDFAAELADSYLVMSRGSIVQQGRGENMEQEGVRGLVAI